ncbi:HD-GYP domain-containing protein [Shewanella acanthi]|uniref:HD-GYP domain-containing protein n=1 Tax=Shewanella acanthi TaxID=2864212 RepID=UPI001C660FCE|nr:HD domain-containing phosphohydrolase [Shewanella acanthi]QYJ79709.1 HD domain-containing protein [Shewanella acanthi]
MDVSQSEQFRITIDVRHAILAVATVLDFVGVDDLHHGHRVAYMAYECANVLNWSEDKKQFVYFAGLIHDCGVSSTNEHLRLLKLMQPEDISFHCVRGFEGLIKCPILDRFSLAILYHHTPWQELIELDIPEFDRDVAALIFLADRTDFLRARYTHGCHEELITLYENLVTENLLAHRETLFKPEMVDAMCQLVNKDGFWYNMEPAHIEKMALDFKENYFYDSELSLDGVIQIARFLAKIVDAKSPFTFYHSEKVALLAKLVAKECGIADLDAELLYVAGLLHDVGKLKTPDLLLHKPGALTREEYSIVKRHTAYTAFTLHSFFPNSLIAQWASNHHERLDGSGYPFRKGPEQLDLPSRILALVDVFQALTQKRPYRGSMSLSEVLEIMLPMVQQGKLDSNVYDVLLADADNFYQLSTQEYEDIKL